MKRPLIWGVLAVCGIAGITYRHSPVKTEPTEDDEAVLRHADPTNPCGPVSVATAAGLCGRPVTLAEARAKVRVNSYQTCSMADLVEGLRALGLGSRAVRIDSQSIRRMRGTTLILWVHGSHFVAARISEGDTLIVVDPPRPPEVFAAADKALAWGGEAVLVAQTPGELAALLERVGVTDPPPDR